MKSDALGKSTSEVEVTNVSRNGFWILLRDRELFLPFDAFPWFRQATIDELMRVELPQAHHLYWPDLDIDLTVESIENPKRYPLVSRAPRKASDGVESRLRRGCKKRSGV